MRVEPPSGDEMDRLLTEMKRNVLDVAGRTPPANRTGIDRVVGAVVTAVLLLGVGSAGAAFAFGILPMAPVSDEVSTDAAPAASEPPARSFPVTTAPPDPGPTSRIGSTCDDLIDTAGLLAFMGDAGKPVVGPISPIADPSASVMTEADRAASEQLGALTCTWSNGIEPDPNGYGPKPWPDRQEFSIHVLPEGLDEAVRYVETYMSADPTYGPNVQGPRCDARAEYCELFGIIGSTWVELHALGIASAGMSDEQLRTLFLEITDPLVEHLRAVSITDRWVPTSSSPSASSDCPALAPTDAIAPLTGVPDLHVGEWRDGPRVGQYWYAKSEVGAHRCSLQFPMSDLSLGNVSILPNGAWAVERYSDEWSMAGAQRVDLPPATGGTALHRCSDAAAACRLDFAVGKDWVSIGLPPVPSSEYVAKEPFEITRSNILAIATVVAERIAELPQ